MNEVIARTIRQVASLPEADGLTKNGFIRSINTKRSRSRQHIEQGAVTEGYKADRTAVISLLNDARATELVCVVRYKRHHFMATGLDAKLAAAEFSEHANEGQVHADTLDARIVPLRGEPGFSPEKLAARSHSEYIAGNSLHEMMQEDLIAERIAIDTDGQIIRYVGDGLTTRRMLEDILANEANHADDLTSMLDGAEERQ
ncbi:MAG: bacterioferritin [Gammaproteobacteria bacterium]|jgi:bacterioferritin